MKKMEYKDGESIANLHGYDGYGEPLKELVQMGDHYEESDTSKTLISVRKSGKWGWIDADGCVKIPFEFDYAWATCTCGIICMKKNGKEGGLFRNDFSQAFAFKYQSLEHMYQDTFLAILPGDDMWGLVKPGDVQLTQPNKYAFLINNCSRYTGFKKRTIFGGLRDGRIDLLTGEEL